MPVGEWTPPEMGDAPEEMKSLGARIYKECRDRHPAENEETKAMCAGSMWTALKGAGWGKNAEGKWVKEAKHLVHLYSEPVSVSSFHDVTLQRLDVLQNREGQKILYPVEPFENVKDWVKIPAIYQRTRGGLPGKHPSFTDVLNETLDPEQYVKVGSVLSPYLTTEGEPNLKGQIGFTNPKCTLPAQAGKLSLSTGFAAPIDNLDDGRATLAGRAIPNHVLLFRRGSCPNCYPNDTGAQFHNQIEGENKSINGDDQMDDESKGYLKKTAESIEKFLNLASPKQEVPPKKEETAMTDPKPNEELVNLTSERDALKKKVEELTNLNGAFKKANDDAKVAFENILKENKDLKWALIENILPKAWIDTPEHKNETRKMYDETPEIFVRKLAEFKNQVPDDKPAEGDEHQTKHDNLSEDWGSVGAPKSKEGK